MTSGPETFVRAVTGNGSRGMVSLPITIRGLVIGRLVAASLTVMLPPGVRVAANAEFDVVVVLVSSGVLVLERVTATAGDVGGLDIKADSMC